MGTDIFSLLQNMSPEELKVFQNITMFREARKSWECFEEVLHKLLLKASVSLAQSRNHLTFDKTSEDGYSDVLLKILEQYKDYGLITTREENNGGHCDISISFGGFKWLGEAKKAKSYDWVYDGFLQLCTRYSTCDSLSKSGGLIIYCGQKKAGTFMTSWMAHLKLKFNDIQDHENHTEDPNIKITKHTHGVSENTYKVIHIPVYLNYTPEK
ncbi:hypothetical protein N5580_21145 (plasmid) [Pantoea piersonii]|uniref:Uncharacterized protein n=1 Tax=Pantoea piersonii TaxID=2364647 RepID=A0AAJ5QNC6_9GAMM|nr:hypothetical protein [Pantoea piersonii]WBG93468.1 hypothetical protein N5580_21145 [Pantoea piersonii]